MYTVRMSLYEKITKSTEKIFFENSICETHIFCVISQSKYMGKAHSMITKTRQSIP